MWNGERSSPIAQVFGLHLTAHGRIRRSEPIEQSPLRGRQSGPNRGVSKDLSVALESVKSPAETMHPSVNSFDGASSAGNRWSSQYLDYWAARDRQRRQKSQETYPALGVVVRAAERFQERLRQGGNLDNRHETTARDFPERCPRNVVAPEGLPSRDGRSVNTKQRRKLADSARRCTLPHGTDQDHHGTKVDLSAEKSHRRRRHPLSAAIAITAEAEPRAILLRQMIRPAPRCPRVGGAVEATTARASFLPRRFGQVLVNRQKERRETPTSMQLMPYHGMLLELGTLKEDTP